MTRHDQTSRSTQPPPQKPHPARRHLDNWAFILKAAVLHASAKTKQPEGRQKLSSLPPFPHQRWVAALLRLAVLEPLLLLCCIFVAAVIAAKALLSSLRFQLICQMNLLSDPDGLKQTRVFPDIYHFNLHPVSAFYPSETWNMWNVAEPVFTSQTGLKFRIQLLEGNVQ